MKNHVTSLEWAKKLKEAGWENESEFGYVLFGENGQHWDLCSIVEIKNIGYKNAISSPLATEILEDLSFIEIIKLSGHFKVFYGDSFSPKCSKGKSLPNCLAECWIYLKQNNLLK